MPKIVYTPKKFTPAHRRIIKQANTFLEEFAAGGFQVTLRTLYYKFVKSNFISNNEKEYKRLGKIIGDARLAGLIDWEHMEDRMRHLDKLTHFSGPQQALDTIRNWYHVDMWENQDWRPEVWIEKDALSGIIRGVCEENDVPFFCCRGYTSLSEMWRASMRLRNWTSHGQKPYIIHLGDHDPSGIDMSRDIEERLHRTFMAKCDFARVALSMDQVNEYKCPPNPAKVTDSRFKEYSETYGDESWELDALEPPVIRALIEERIAHIRNDAQWNSDLEEKAAVKEQLGEVAKDWEDIPTMRASIADLEKQLGDSERELGSQYEIVKQQAAEIKKLKSRKKGK